MFDLLIKDLRVFAKEWTSSLLVLLGPLTIMLLIGFIFSGQSTDLVKSKNIQEIRLLVCDLDGGDVSGNFTEGLEEFDFLTIMKTDSPGCDDYFTERITREGFRMGIVFPPNYSKDIQDGKQRNLTVYFDNSDYSVRSLLQSTISLSFQELTREFGKTYLEEVWASLREMTDEVSELSDSLDDSRGDIDRMQSDLQQSRSDFEELNITDFRENLQYLLERTEELGNTTDEKLVELDDMLSDIDGQSGDVSRASEDAESFKTGLAAFSEGIGNTTTALEGVRSSLSLVQAQAAEPTRSQLGAVLQNLDLIIEGTRSLSNQTSSLSTAFEGVQSGISDTSSYLRTLKEKMQDTRDGVQDSRSEISDVKSRIGTVLEEIDELDTLRSQNLQTMGTTQDKMTSMASDIQALQEDLNDSKGKLQDVVDVDPESITSPTAVQTVELFENRRQIDFLFGGILSAVILFSAMLLSSVSILREKNAGTLNRMLLAPMPKAYPVLSITFVNLLFMLVQSVVGTLTVVWAFNVVSAGSLLEVVLLGGILSLPFVCLGVLLGLLSKTENTAVLFALTVGLPSLFLSNSIYAFEFMPDFMAAIGQYTPLYYGATAIREVVVLGRTFMDVSKYWIPLLIYALVLEALAIFAVYRYKEKL